MNKNKTATFFSLFNEIGIIGQLSQALLESRMPNGLSTSHFGILNHLIRLQDGRTPLELSRAFQVPKTTMTHTLTGLEKHKLVEIRPNSNDGRSKCVWLTQKGREFREQTIIDLEPELAKLEAQFPLDDVAALVEKLVKIREFLDSNRN